jgi:ribosomal protein L32
MSDKLQPFDNDSKCKACGLYVVAKRYCPGFPRNDDCEFKVNSEHMHRTCASCGYKWAESLPLLSK